MIHERSPSRLSLAVALSVAAGFALAQSAPPPQLEPLPEIPPPPGLSSDPELEPQVTVTKKESETVEEARVNGRLVWVKVTPRHGKSYYLIPDGSGNVMIRDGLDSGLRIPLWVLFSF
jgi:hypothetical protein